MANIRLIAVSAALVSGFVLSCKKEYPPGPLPAKNGKRDYVWSIDSIDYAGRATPLELECPWGTLHGKLGGRLLMHLACVIALPEVMSGRSEKDKAGSPECVHDA